MKSAFSLSIAGVLCLLAGDAAADEAAPEVKHRPVSEAVRGEPIIVEAEIRDESKVFHPTLYYRRAGADDYDLGELQETREPAVYRAVIPASAVVADIEYYLEAYDELGNGPARHGNATKPNLVHVGAAAEVASPVAPAEAARVIEAVPESGKVAAEGAPAPATQEVLAREGLFLGRTWTWVAAGGAVAFAVVAASLAGASGAWQRREGALLASGYAGAAADARASAATLGTEAFLFTLAATAGAAGATVLFVMNF